MAILFNNQNWRLRFDSGFLKLGIPTLKTDAYHLFWVSNLLTGVMDKTSTFYQESSDFIPQLKKGKCFFF